MFIRSLLILPFVLLLGAMALAPVLAPQAWRRHYPLVSLGLGGVTAAGLLLRHDWAGLGHAAHEYVGFIALVGSLFVVAGGIRLQVPGGATPGGNALFLLAGALAANVLGTTGAAMLLIRPWIQMNRPRMAAHHIVFFIFLVANVGGCLTPIGDPPLFLGFLQGVPFWWVARQCWPVWLVGVGLLLALFLVVDGLAWSRAPKAAQPASAAAPGGWRLEGVPNLFFLSIILGAVFINRPPFLREALMLGAAAGAYFTTPKSIQAANGFHFHPLNEVAVLFAGIFVTMVPALAWLSQNAGTWLGAAPSPGMFFWSTGGLSAVLDNAPTYLGFLNALFGIAGTGSVAPLLVPKAACLVAISVGAVFFGAATYLGNGPNFMVKTMAEAHGVAMSSFAGFVLKYTLPCLLPVLLMVWWLFFRS